MKVGRVHRLLRLITLMQRGVTMSAAELATELGVSRRTLFRDLNTLEAAGIPYDHKPSQGYRIEPSFFLPPVNLQVSEAMGLMLMAKNAQATPQQPFSSTASEAINKLLTMMPPGIREVCQEMMGNVSVNPGATAKVKGDADNYALLQQAIDEKRIVTLTYNSLFDGDTITTDLRPYHLHYSVRAWYVIGHSGIHKQVRVFKLARIADLQFTKRTFVLRKPFSVEQHFGKAWQMIPEGKVYQVELEFTPKVAQNVAEVRWHPSMEHRIADDGCCHVAFEVDGLGEITWWLLGYGDQVRVLKPAALRKRVQQVYAAALKQYDNGSDG